MEEIQLLLKTIFQIKTDIFHLSLLYWVILNSVLKSLVYFNSFLFLDKKCLEQLKIYITNGTVTQNTESQNDDQNKMEYWKYNKIQKLFLIEFSKAKAKLKRSRFI